MINLAVVNLKDIVRYTLKTCAILLVLWIMYQFFSKSTINNTTIVASFDKATLIECIDEMIPGIRQLNNKEIYTLEETDIEKVNPSKLMLGMQIEMLNNLQIKEQQEITPNTANEQTTENVVEQAQTGLQTQVVENNVPNKYTNEYNGVKIKNETKYELTEEMLKPDIEVNSKNIMIFHTHTCESYTQSEKYTYEQTGTYRTTDINYNVVRVGTELENQLLSYGYNVVHDKTYHDYPAYSGSYGRSLTTVKNLLNMNPNTDVVIDVHRDAIGDYSYAPTVKIGEEYAAQLMFVIGTDGSGLEHQNWNQNLKFAVKVQEKANEMYPGLFKSIILRNSRYNQHLTKAASIIEVGATGNTMDQCLVSMKYLAKVISEVVK